MKADKDRLDRMEQALAAVQAATMVPDLSKGWQDGVMRSVRQAAGSAAGDPADVLVARLAMACVACAAIIGSVGVAAGWHPYTELAAALVVDPAGFTTAMLWGY